MFELYTNVNLILIELECIENTRNSVQRQRERADEMLVKKHTARRKFVVFKALIYLGIMALLGVTIFQLTVVYTNHRDENLKDFVRDGTEGLFEGITLNSIFYQ